VLCIVNMLDHRHIILAPFLHIAIDILFIRQTLTEIMCLHSSASRDSGAGCVHSSASHASCAGNKPKACSSTKLLASKQQF
jgi:hypothetical protein